jgi:hypothetical protein
MAISLTIMIFHPWMSRSFTRTYYTVGGRHAHFEHGLGAWAFVVRQQSDHPPAREPE